GGGAGFIRWEPGWFLQIMFEAPDRIGWAGPVVRRYGWEAEGRWLLVVIFWLAAAAIFVVGNLGTRLVGLLTPKKLRRSLTGRLLAWLVFFGFLPTMFFTQKHVAWNTIQFVYYAVFATGLLAAAGFENLALKLPKFWLVSLGFGLALFSIPGSLRTVSWHLSSVPATQVSAVELTGLNWLKENTDKEAVVLVYPYQAGQESQITPPIPLAYYNTTYVPFFSNRRAYLADETAALIQGYDHEERKNRVWGFFRTTDSQTALNFLSSEGIDYIYLVGSQSWQAQLGDNPRPVYQEGEVRIYAVF
ncbi:hypothetical protein MUP65_03050, partial [Patescibacteria group bacterium]|nr:hypothetical protein [Patescibacteria group bacterium]